MRCSSLLMALATCWAAACPSAPAAQSAACANYQRCFLDDNGGGVRTLGDESANEPALRCYDAFGGEDADGAVALLRGSYALGGFCTEPTGDDAADEANRSACEAHCLTELRADCRRQREDLPSACDVIGEDACAFADVDETEDTATLPTCEGP